MLPYQDHPLQLGAAFGVQSDHVHARHGCPALERLREDLRLHLRAPVRCGGGRRGVYQEKGKDLVNTGAGVWYGSFLKGRLGGAPHSRKMLAQKMNEHIQIQSIGPG